MGVLSESGCRYEPDIMIGRSLGAKHKDILVKLPNGKAMKQNCIFIRSHLWAV